LTAKESNSLCHQEQQHSTTIMSEAHKSLLGSSASSYGTSSHINRSRVDEEDPVHSRHARITSWHKHDSDIMTGGDHHQDSAFAPLVRSFSSGRAEKVAESAAEQAVDAKRRRPIPQQQQQQAVAAKGGKRFYRGGYMR